MAGVFELVTMFLLAFIPLFIVIDPFAAVAVFVTVTTDRDKKEKLLTARDACIYAFCFLLAFAFAGKLILDYMGISIAALKTAGGLLLTIVGLNMLKEGDNPKSKKIEKQINEAEERAAMIQAPDEFDRNIVEEMGHSAEIATGGKVWRGGDVALVPLALPMLAGPGAISLIIVQMQSYPWYIPTSALVITLLLCFAILAVSRHLFKFLGANGARALTRIMGFLTAAFAMQYILSGITEWANMSGWL
ncbi:MAG: hypothetical protein CVT48_02985 [Thermoplasmata archaeon HGW-Thermoplasmata-1]|nr:MAG: hypothetical protein CVT48_02985 [Thermoplasmata archaeon HGW-Thermoplasmata-1]